MTGTTVVTIQVYKKNRDMRINVTNTEMVTDRKRWAVTVKNVDTTKMVEDGNG